MMLSETQCQRGRKEEEFSFGPWKITSIKAHITKSDIITRLEEELKLPQLPEMLFNDNVLRIEHGAGFGIEFNALDALRRVDTKQDSIKVAAAQEWRDARKDCEFIDKVVKPFDWTYTTDYKGTLLETKTAMKVSPTDKKIDMEKLKVRETIHFYEDMTLFEDELADNGTATLGVKMRVMQSGFFILLRFFLRVDGVLIRINDTRLYHEPGQNFILREYSSKEKQITDMKLEPHELTDPVVLDSKLDSVYQEVQELQFPPEASEIEST